MNKKLYLKKKKNQKNSPIFFHFRGNHQSPEKARKYLTSEKPISCFDIRRSSRELDAENRIVVLFAGDRPRRRGYDQGGPPAPAEPGWARRRRVKEKAPGAPAKGDGSHQKVRLHYRTCICTPFTSTPFPG